MDMTVLRERRRRGEVHSAEMSWVDWRGGRWWVTFVQRRTRVRVWYARREPAAEMLLQANLP